MYLAQQNLHFLEQGRRLLGELSDELFACGDEHGHSCVGAHLRHVLDCYRCFLGGLETGQIDYDARQRNPRLEKERTVASTAIEELAAGLATLDEQDRHRPLEVRVDAAAWGESDAWTSSTVGRELQFLLSHTVHHYALIAMTLRVKGYRPDPSFGVAPSTLEHLGTSFGGSPMVASPEPRTARGPARPARASAPAGAR